MLGLSKHDKREIEKLKEMREWVKWYRNLSEEEKERLIYERWKENEDQSDK